MTKAAVPRRRWLWLAALPAIGVAGYAGGFVSNWTSHRACERYAGRQIRMKLEGPRPLQGNRNTAPLVVFSLAESSPHSPRALRDAGLVVQACQKRGSGFDCWPWGDVKEPDPVAPYVVELSWGYVAAPLAGEGIRTRMLCLFGLVIPLRNEGMWWT